MSFFEIIVTVVALMCCAGGVAWFLYDIDKQIKEYSAMKQAEEESTLGLVEDDEE